MEHTWNIIVQEIKNIYGQIPFKRNYIYFVCEGEFRLNIYKKSKEKKLDIFYKILHHIFTLNEYDFSSIEGILDFDNYNDYIFKIKFQLIELNLFYFLKII